MDSELDQTVPGPVGGRGAMRTPPPPRTLPSDDGRASSGGGEGYAGRYRLGPELGRGGIGVVQAAIDGELRREVAVKRLLQARANRVEQFVEEAQITGQLEHPNIVPVHDLGHDADGRPWLAMKKVQGQTLSELINRWSRRLRQRLLAEDLNQILQLFLKVCDAIAFAHSRGVIHRDLKPDNIMIGEFGEVMVMDWGLAKPIGKAAGGKSRLVTVAGANTGVSASGRHTLVETARRIGESGHQTMDGAVQGTPGYMPPEQAAGNVERIGFASDVFALGAVLYAMLTLKAPYVGTTLKEVLLAAVQRNLQPPRKRAPARQIPVEIEAIVLKAMAKEPEQRYRSVADLRDDLHAWQNHLPVSARRAGPLRRMQKWSRRNPTGTAVLALSVLFVLVGTMAGSLFMAYAAEQQRLAEQADAARTAAEESERSTQRQRELEAQAHAQQQQLARVREMAQQGRIADLQRELNVKLVAQRTQQIEDFNARLEQARQRGVPAAEFVRNLGSDERLALIAAFDRARKLHAEQPDAITYDTVDVTYHSLLVAFHNPRDPRPVEWLGELIAAQPHDPFLFNLRGILHQERGDLKAAEADYTATLALTPDAAETLTNRALARAGSGNTAGAIADATRALELQPDYLNAWRAMGVANHMQGRLPEAIDAYSEVLRRRPQHVQCRVMRADAYCELKKYREGMDDFAQALKDEPGSPHALMTRAHAWERMRRNNKAIEDYTTVIDANPLASEALGRRGACHLAEGNHADALRDLREAVRLAPDRSLFHFNLAITLVHTGDRAAAKQAFADAERTAPSEAARQQVISERKALLGE